MFVVSKLWFSGTLNPCLRWKIVCSLANGSNFKMATSFGSRTLHDSMLADKQFLYCLDRFIRGISQPKSRAETSFKLNMMSYIHSERQTRLNKPISWENAHNQKWLAARLRTSLLFPTWTDIPDISFFHLHRNDVTSSLFALVNLFYWQKTSHIYLLLRLYWIWTVSGSLDKLVWMERILLRKKMTYIFLGLIAQYNSTIQCGSPQWRHDGCMIVYSTVFFRRRSKKTSKLRATGLDEGNSSVTGELPAQRASNVENVPIWWRHHDYFGTFPKLALNL